MNQVSQSLSTGEANIVDVRGSARCSGGLLVRQSFVSSGTERMLADFAKDSCIDKARPEPERVREVLARLRTGGVLTTMSSAGG
jgi:hypothetical protein